MFRNLAEDIAFLLIKNKIVDIEKRDTYIHIIETVLKTVLILVILLVCMYLFTIPDFTV